jgi:hypothetical protein
VCTHDWERMFPVDAALAYAHLGYCVLPLARGSKKPHPMLGPTGGVHWASSHPGRIGSWWNKDPEANIGVACGQGSQLGVLDLDRKHGNVGTTELMVFLSNNRLELPPVPICDTPSGGVHLWLRTALTERQHILPGVDIKGEGGYVVAAPSTVPVWAGGDDGEHGGEIPVSYRWRRGVCPCQAPVAPGWLASWARDAVAARSSVSQHGNLPDPDGLLRNGIPQGERNSTMHRTACSLFRRFGTDPAGSDMVTEKLREIWMHTDHRDYPWEEVLISRDSARRFIERRVEAEDNDAYSSRGWLRRHGGG